MSRAFSDIFAEQNVHRLAGFFRNFRDHLLSLRGPREGRAAILSPGPLNDTYFEQAWLARYLGFALVQGEDLSVAQGQLMLRTVSGLKPIDVLWRRLDGGYADPLELDAHSRIGVAGMVSALRRGGLTMVNALGSGLLETRALMDVMAQLSQQLLGAPLQLPNVASWWYGDGPSDPQSPPQPERMPLSTTPALVAGELVPRPMSLRVFVARTASGWQVMQGGFARIGASADPSALAMQRGGTAADVWILSQADVPSDTMVAPPPGPYRRHAPDALPARAADNLFWMGRYVERCENMLRLLRARHIRSAEGGASHPLMALIDRQLSTFGIDGPAPHLPQALLQTIGAAVASAAKVRDRFSPDAWSALHDLDKTTRRMAQSLHPGDDAARGLSALLRKLAGFSGLVHDNMYRFHGWGFLSIGRMQERGLTMANHLAVLCDPKAPAGALDLCIELGDSVLIHRQRFTIGSTRQTVVDLLGLDPMNPRSLRYQCETMASLGLTLPGTSHHGQLSELGRALVRLQADVATQTPESLDSAALAELAAHLAALSDLITEAYLR